jgi:hypothetical protein
MDGMKPSQVEQNRGRHYGSSACHPRRPHTCCWIDSPLTARSSRDVDVSGFSIFGAPGTDGRRHRFHNDGHIVDLRPRLSR